MVIKKNQATPISANSASTIWDYPMPDEERGLTYQTLTGRLPEKGWYRNTICHELFFIISGSASLHIDEETHEVSAGDLVIIKAGQKHFGTYKDVTMVTITSPNWYEKQCELLPD